ncbi:MAG: DNA cytosine methyltransferase, partial [Spirochaetales bacterium]|nr:DNA cytosine methyltransferase [Spirochaetales bacterium]
IELLDNELHPIPKADVVIGGPPCQGFSLLNKKRDSDPRRRLWVQFMRIVELSQASVVVMENVPQLLSSYEFEEICMTLSALNFKYIEADTLVAANYGVPEVRKRTIIMASKDAPISLPRPTHINPKKKQADRDFFSNRKLEPWTTVKSAIGDLPKPEGTEIRDVAPPLNLHFGRTPTDKSLERYKAVPVGGNRFDLQKNRPDITPNCWIKK